MKRKTLLFCISLLVTLFAVTLLPSSNLTEEAQERYLEMSDDFSFKNIDFLFPTAYAEGTFGTGVAIPIPLDEVGRKPNPNNFTDNTYEDETIKVRIETGEFNKAVYHVAYVQIADPSQLRTGVSGKVTGSKTIQVSDFAPKLNAVVAINGDFYTQLKVGYIVRQGDVLRKKVSNSLDALLIDNQGDFHIITAKGKAQGEEISAVQEKHEIVNSFLFGPALVIDGQGQVIPEDYQFGIKYRNPRVILAQMDKLSYALIMVEGRSNESKGLTGADLVELCVKLNVKHAYNLDGGNSAVLYFKDGLYFDRSKENERFVSDVVYFSSATLE